MSHLLRRCIPILVPLLWAAGCQSSNPAARLKIHPAASPAAASTGAPSVKNPGLRPAATPTPNGSPLPSPVPSYPTIAAQPVAVSQPTLDGEALSSLTENYMVLSIANAAQNTNVQVNVADTSAPTVTTSTPSPASTPIPVTGSTVHALSYDHPSLRQWESVHVAPYAAARPARYGVKATSTPLAVGTNLNFWVITNFDTANYEDTQITAHVAQVGAHCYVLLDNQVATNTKGGQQLLQKAKAIADTFDTGIYPTDTSIFGSEPNPGIDDDPRIFILLSPAVGDYGKDNTLGFFSQRDEFKPTASSEAIFQHSNSHEMINVSSTLVQTGSAEDYMGTIAHEFQHMINFNQKVLIGRNKISEDLWIDEGMAMYAMEANGYGLKTGAQVLGNHVTKFQSEPTAYSLTDWENNPDQSGYGPVYLFMVYLADRFGEGIIHEIVTSPKIGTANLDDVLRKRGTAFNRVFHDWCLTNLIDPIPQNNLANYRYSSLRMVGPDGATNLSGFTTEHLSLPGSAAFTVRPYMMHIFELSQGQIAPRFTLGTTADAAAVPRLILDGSSGDE